MALVAAGLSMGLVADLLLHDAGEPGLGLFLWFVGLALSVVVVSRAARRRLGPEAVASLALGVLLASGIVLRAAPALGLLALLGAAAAFAFPALRAGVAWLRRGGVTDQIEAVLGAMAYSALGTLRLAVDQLSSGAATRPAGRRRAVAAFLRGLLIAVPFLAVFGALFMSADRVFARLVTDFVLVDLEVLASHALLTGVFGWLTCGYLTGFLTGTRLRGLVETRLPRPTIGIIEVATALALVDLLFLAFVAVQLRYLFGGSGLVEVTPGLTYAEYTREGFAQLAAASALVLPSLLASDWLLRRQGRRDERIFRTLGALQLLLLLVVIASALQRVSAYQAAYGLTESRFYGAVFLGWLTLLTVWFAATVLRGRRDRFAFPALASGYALVAALFVANPDVRIARANLARAPVAELPSTDPPRPPFIDAAYLGSLSADAVPTLLRALPDLPPDARCTLAGRLLQRWGPERREGLDWREWNRSVARARRAVEAEAGALRSMAEPDGGCARPPTPSGTPSA